ncbi:MAG TPA: hypothetical protein EYP53_06155 [Candidatus Latescibacteria bacterium]|nr:hypothetical protein [Candidatus Latescibacterota bacterium]
MKKAVGLVLLFIFPFVVFVAVLLFATGSIDVKTALVDIQALVKRGQDEVEDRVAETVDALPAQRVTSSLGEERDLIEEERQKLERERLELRDEKERLSRLKKEVEGLLGRLNSLQDQRVMELARLYNSMRADKAAAIARSLDDSTVAKILVRMRARQAAEVLSALEPARAARITDRMSRLY